MMREALPEECTRELDYCALLETLRLLEGEEVSLSFLGMSRCVEGNASRAGIVGRLRNIGYTWAEGFAVGGGGRVLLREPDFVAASLWTFDGNDFFRITVQFGDLTLVLADLSDAADEFEM